MAKLGVVKRGWRLESVLSVKVEPASLFKGKLPKFVPTSETSPGGWRGGEKWQSFTTPGPWGLPGVV